MRDDAADLRVMRRLDDDLHVRSNLENLARSAGREARCFADPRDFLSDVSAFEVSCVITDLHMPGMSGLELQAEVAGRGLDLPVIVMTAYPTAETRAQAMAAGALAYFTKPIDPDELLSTLAATVAWPFMPPSD